MDPVVFGPVHGVDNSLVSVKELVEAEVSASDMAVVSCKDYYKL